MDCKLDATKLNDAGTSPVRRELSPEAVDRIGELVLGYLREVRGSSPDEAAEIRLRVASIEPEHGAAAQTYLVARLDDIDAFVLARAASSEPASRIRQASRAPLASQR